jgi:cell division protein FtsL
VVLSALILVAGFPISTLLSQHRQIAATATQLARLDQQNRSLRSENSQLTSKAEIEQLARQEYQLVLPGQTVFNVLPPQGQSTTSGSAVTGTVPGDPADQPLVPPSEANGVASNPTAASSTGTGTGSGTGTGGSAGAAGAAGAGSTVHPGPSVPAASSGAHRVVSHGFWSRLGGSLEFWK